MRKFLKKNKNSFKIISLISQAIASLLVSVAAVLVSISQCNEMKKQTEIQSKQYDPQFFASIDLFKNKNNFYSNDRLVLINKGYTVSIKSVDVIVLCDITKSKGVEVLNKDIILQDYYSASFHNYTKNNEVASFYGYNNNLKFYRLLQSFIKYSNSKQYIGFIELHKYLRIIYYNYMNKPTEVYLSIDEISGSIPLDVSIGKELFKYNKLSISIDHITADTLFNY